MKPDRWRDRHRLSRASEGGGVDCNGCKSPAVLLGSALTVSLAMVRSMLLSSARGVALERWEEQILAISPKPPTAAGSAKRNLQVCLLSGIPHKRHLAGPLIMRERRGGPVVSVAMRKSARMAR